MSKKTAVGTPDWGDDKIRDKIRKDRLTWVAETMKLPAARVRQAARQAGSLRNRRGEKS